MSQWITRLYGSGQPLVYQSLLNGKVFATQWTTCVDVLPEGLIEIHSFAETDTAVLGQGGSLLRRRAKLTCDTAFDPIRYRSESGGKSWGLEFDRERVVVHPPGDEPARSVPRGGAQYLLDGSGHQAIIAALLHEQGRLAHASLTVFLPGPLLAAPYTISAAPEIGDGCLRSSHEEELCVDSNGVMRACRIPKKGVTTDLLIPPPPLPAWRDDLLIAPPVIPYVPPKGARFRPVDVTIDGPITPIGGTLTIPDGAGPFPAALFLSGSGTHDRHGIAGEIDMGTHEIMDHIAERGFVGLRYDTRGAGTTQFGRDVLDLGLSALIDDAQACLDFLRRRHEVDPGRVFLIGHSQGGILALALAVHRRAEPRGIVLMACMGRRIDEVMLDQIRSQARVIGLSDAQRAVQEQELKAFVELAISDRPWEPGVLPDHLLGLVRSRKWLREHLENSPTALIARVCCPVLVCQGDKDFQVSAERDAEPLVAAARRAGVDVELGRFPDLDHLFKRVEGQSRMAQYYDRDRHVSPALLEWLDSWLAAHL
jgi:alpha-beta hydrolase superfamily lysophospholipase